MSKRGKYGNGRVYQPKWKDKDGTVRTVEKFYIQYYDRDRNQHREPTDAKTETEARKILTAKLGEAQKGNAPKVDEKSLRYGDLRADLLHHYRIRKSRSLELLSDGSETMKGLTKLDEFFGYKGEHDKGAKVATFTSRAWENNFIMARRGEGVSDATIRNSAILLRQMFNLALSAKRISSAPKVMVPPSPEAREEYLSKEQFDSLFARNGMPKKFHPVLAFLFYQGVRIGETLSIEWKQLDLNAGVFKPNAAKNKTANTTPKSLHREVVKVLRPIQRASGLLFDGITQKMFEKAFRRTMLRLKFGKPTWQCSQCRATKDAPAPTGEDRALECPNCRENALQVPMQYHYVGPTPHCLRASAVVYYRESGMPDAMIMEITGHSSPKSFLGYSRTRAEMIKDKMDSAELNRNRIRKEDAKASRPHLVA